MSKRFSSLAILALFAVAGGGCLDWGGFGGPPNGNGREGEGEGGGGEGEGQGGEGEGQGGEGEGQGGEGEGEGEGTVLSGPLWVVIDAPITAQAELASAGPAQLSSSSGRLFAVGSTHLFELVSDALVSIASPVVPCASANLVGPVVVDGTDLIVGTDVGAVRFHDDGSCDPPYNLQQGTLPVNAVAAFAGGALVFDGLAVHLFDTSGTDTADHAFDTNTSGGFYPDPSDAHAVILVRGDAQSPGQEVRISKPGADLVVEIVADSAGLLAGSSSATFAIDSALGAPFLHVTSGTTTKDLRLARSDFVNAFTSDPDGEIAIAGPSALLAHEDLSASSPSVVSLSGERFGTPTRIVQSPGGEVWAVGTDVILHWSSSSASAFSDPDIIYRDTTVNDRGGLVAVDGSLFFIDNSRLLHRADVSGNTLDIVQIVDSVSFAPISTFETNSRFAFLPATGSAPDRIIEVGGFDVGSYELTADLGAVTASLSGTTMGSSASGVAILPDASKAAVVVFSELFACSLTLPVGAAPSATCDGGRSTGVSSPGAVTIIDPSPGVDDETYVVSGFGSIGVLDPGSSVTNFDVDVSQSVAPLVVHGCVLTFGSGWNALDTAQPLAPKARRDFTVRDAAVVGNRVMVVGSGDTAGQISSIPAPVTSTCNDAAGHPVLDGAAMPSGAVRSQTDLQAVAFLSGELYALDADGVLWHVPTP